jgi:hypothetical protein
MIITLEALSCPKKLEKKLREWIQQTNLGILAYQKGEYQPAEQFSKQGLRIFLDMDAHYGIFYDIGGLVGAALGMGKPKRAAKLLGFSSAGLESLESIQQQADRVIVRHILDETKQVLDKQLFEKAWEEGRRMTVQEAFEYALEG